MITSPEVPTNKDNVSIVHKGPLQNSTQATDLNHTHVMAILIHKALHALR